MNVGLVCFCDTRRAWELFSIVFLVMTYDERLR